MMVTLEGEETSRQALMVLPARITRNRRRNTSSEQALHRPAGLYLHLSNNFGYALAVEKLMALGARSQKKKTANYRAEVIRV
jgi:hypothetical protein